MADDRAVARTESAQRPGVSVSGPGSRRRGRGAAEMPPEVSWVSLASDSASSSHLGRARGDQGKWLSWAERVRARARVCACVTGGGGESSPRVSLQVKGALAASPACLP